MAASRPQMLGVDVLAGLQHLHSSGFLMCDLKPKNLLLTEYGQVKLADMALACAIPRSPPKDRNKVRVGCCAAATMV